MTQKTQRFTTASTWSSLRNTMNIITGTGLSSYTLLFIDPAENYPKGSHISVNNRDILIGRAENCQIKYDQQFPMVSREHCTIKCINGKEILMHNPAASNPTLVNGVEITFDHVLRNGDEMQFSFNGPKLRYNKIEPQLAKAGITGRLNVAIKQATKPLKILIILLSFVTLGLISFAVVNGISYFRMKAENEKTIAILETLNEEKGQLEADLEVLTTSGNTTSNEIRSLRNKIRDYDNRIAELRSNLIGKNGGNDTEPSPGKIVESPKVEPINKGSEEFIEEEPEAAVEVAPKIPEEDIYFIIATSITITKPTGESKEFKSQDLVKAKIIDYNQNGLWSGVGFLTKDKKVVTGRHVIQPWRFLGESSTLMKWLSAVDGDGKKISVRFQANKISDSGSQIDFSSEDVTMNSNNDIAESLTLKTDQFGGVKFSSKNISVKKAKDPMTDIAVIESTESGSLKFKSPGETPEDIKVYAVGVNYYREVPKKTKSAFGTKPESVKTFTASYTGITFALDDVKIKGKLNSSKCVPVDKSFTFDFGKTGGPVFISQNGEAIPVGIVPHSSLGRNCFIPYNNK